MNRNREGKTYLGDFGVLEALLYGNGVPVNVRPVLGVLDDGEEEHCLGGRGLGSLLRGLVGHGWLLAFAFRCLI